MRRPRRCAAPAQGVLDPVRSNARFGRPGERVVEGLVGEPVLEHATIRDVVRRQDDAAHRLVVQQVAEHALDRPEASVCVAQVQLAFHLGLRRDGGAELVSDRWIVIEEHVEGGADELRRSCPSIVCTDGVT